MTVTSPVRRPSVGARRAGYVVAAVVNAALWYVVNQWPGWQALSFLTDETVQVLGWVNLSLVVGIAVNVGYLAYDPPWVTSLGALATTGIGLAVLVQLWRVFPFDFGDASVDWEILARIGLLVASVGAVIGILTQLVALVRAACGRS
jgi:hypothetical protein